MSIGLTAHDSPCQIHRQRRIRVASLLVVGVAASTYASHAKGADVFDRLPAFVLVRPHYGNGEVIAQHILDLKATSSAFRALLQAVGRYPKVRILVAPVSDGQRSAHALGWTTMGVKSGGLTAAVNVRVDLNDPSNTAQALAHEFAHVLEAVCWSDTNSLADLRAHLRERGSVRRSAGGFEAFETPFAEAMTRVVMQQRSHSLVGDASLLPIEDIRTLRQCAGLSATWEAARQDAAP